MNKAIIWILVLILLGGVVFAVYRSTGVQPEASTTPAPVLDDSSLPPEDDYSLPETMEDGTVMPTSGSYEPYSAARVALASPEQPVVLFFRAPWCPTCRALDADIRAKLSAIPTGLTILDVDYDTATELKQRYGVTYQHTLVQVDAQGNLLKKWSGSPTLAALAGQVI